MKPSNFATYPWSSIFQNSESEVVALNIMTILKRTGDEFRPLSWTEYKEERMKDGNFSVLEMDYFHKVVPYCKSENTAALFSKAWANVNQSDRPW